MCFFGQTNLGMCNFTYLESLCALQTTYMNPGTVSDESSPCATIHWVFPAFVFHAYAAKHQVFYASEWIPSARHDKSKSLGSGGEYGRKAET